MVLCHSRMLYVEFSLAETMEHFLAAHQHAFEFFRGVPQQVMVDNCKSVFGKWQKSTLTLLYRGFDSYRWVGCKRIQLIIQLT
jgi:transposase